MEFYGPAVMLTDSQTPVNMFKKPVTMKNKHMPIYVHYVKHLVAKKLIRIEFILRDIKVADMNMKQSLTKEFQGSWKLETGDCKT